MQTTGAYLLSPKLSKLVICCINLPFGEITRCTENMNIVHNQKLSKKQTNKKSAVVYGRKQKCYDCYFWRRKRRQTKANYGIPILQVLGNEYLLKRASPATWVVVWLALCFGGDLTKLRHYWQMERCDSKRQWELTVGDYRRLVETHRRVQSAGQLRPNETPLDNTHLGVMLAHTVGLHGTCPDHTAGHGQRVIRYDTIVCI